MGTHEMLEILYAKIRAAYFGLAGVLLIGVCTLIAGLGFMDLRGETYSIFNHYISELGTVTSQLAWVFNLGLLVGIPCIGLFMLGTRSYLKSWLAHLGRIFGVLASIGGFFVGIFPGNMSMALWREEDSRTTWGLCVAALDGNLRQNRLKNKEL